MAASSAPDFTMAPSKVGAEHASREGLPAGLHAVYGPVAAATRVLAEGRLTQKSGSKLLGALGPHLWSPCYAVAARDDLTLRVFANAEQAQARPRRPEATFDLAQVTDRFTFAA